MYIQEISKIDMLLLFFYNFKGITGKVGSPGDAGLQGLPVSVTSDP